MIRAIIKFYIYALLIIAIFDLIARIPNDGLAVMIGVIVLICAPELLQAFAPQESRAAYREPRLLPSPTAAEPHLHREPPVRLVRVHGP